MQIETLLLLILAAAVSLGLVIFQYPALRKRHQRYQFLLALLRFLGVFSLFLLLINPKFVKEQYYLVKSKLIILADNSASISDLGAGDTVVSLIDRLSSEAGLTERFELQVLKFDRELTASDSLTFDRQTTDIHSALRTVQRTYRGQSAAIVLLSDGNQTVGTDYEFINPLENQQIYPVVVGDTTAYEDLVLEQINANKYAFLDNQYPIEVLVNYQGPAEVSVPLTVSVNGSSKFRQQLKFSRQKNSQSVQVLLRAEAVGIQLIEVEVGSLQGEKNTANNRKTLAVEVIDEKTEVVVVSEMNHPDLGALRKAIESNDQRSVRLVKPSDNDLSLLDRADVVILYQPGRSFQSIYGIIDKRSLNYFTITGPETDWNFLNRIQDSYQKKSFNQEEYVSPVLNDGFSTFDISNFSTANLPPLQTTLGELLIDGSPEVIIDQRIKGVSLGDPLLCLLNNDNKREVVLFGQDLWKWRLQWFRDEGSFTAFDEFIGKIILFLATDDTRQRLTVEYDNIFRDANAAKIRAAYFDETYEFDKNAGLTLRISGIDEDSEREIPLLLKGNYYEADLGGLPAGTFGFTLLVEDSSIRKSGQFTILDFAVEKQYATANYRKLDRLSNRSKGRSFFPDQTDELIGELTANERFVPTQKSEQNIVSLIDYRILLALIIGAFSAEWFIRKYNGLI